MLVIPKGPWYYFECTQMIEGMDTKDPTLDFIMLDYLRTGKIPDEFEEED